VGATTSSCHQGSVNVVIGAAAEESLFSLTPDQPSSGHLPVSQRKGEYTGVSASAVGWGTFRFLGSQCRGCPLWEACRGMDSPPTSQRAVYSTPYHQHLREGAAFVATEEGRALLRSHWQVEPTIAWLVRYNGCRRARRVGQEAAQCQVFQACAVRNL
jgi:hypothetical protein